MSICCLFIFIFIFYCFYYFFKINTTSKISYWLVNCYKIVNEYMFRKWNLYVARRITNIDPNNNKNKRLRSVHFGVVVVELINCKCGGIVRNEKCLQ